MAVEQHPHLHAVPRTVEDVAEMVGALDARVTILTDSQLQTSGQIGQIAASLARIERRLDNIEAMPGDEQPSYQELQGDMLEAMRNLHRRSKSPADPLTPEAARAISQEVLQASKVATELGTWRALKGGVLRLGLKGLWAAAAGLIGWLAHWLTAKPR